MFRALKRSRLRVEALAVALLAASAVEAELPAALDDATYWNLVRTLSEQEGRFAGQYMSNEDSLPFVMSELVQRAVPGGAYIGVGTEQNFTYIAALRPGLAFIVDIRRDNLRQMLLYKRCSRCRTTGRHSLPGCFRGRR